MEMTNIFLVADLHLGHANACVFLRGDGTKLRPWDNSDQMNEDMIRFWNEDVKPRCSKMIKQNSVHEFMR